MTKAKAAAVPTVANPIEFRYVGPGHLEDVPAEDLTPHAVNRAVYVATAARGAGLLPGDEGFDEARESVVARLNLSGHYEATAPIPAPVPVEPESPAKEE